MILLAATSIQSMALSCWRKSFTKPAPLDEASDSLFVGDHQVSAQFFVPGIANAMLDIRPVVG